jgi:hypothetical protein
MRGTAHLARKPQMPALAPASPRRDDALDLMSSSGKGPLNPLDEGPEIRVIRPGVHLGDEEDSQRGYGTL